MDEGKIGAKRLDMGVDLPARITDLGPRSLRDPDRRAQPDIKSGSSIGPLVRSWHCRGMPIRL
jgi:hypothetical protein